MRPRSLSSAGAVYLDRPGRIEKLRQAAARAQGRLGWIHRAILFGSLATGSATPRSDADLLIVVDQSPHIHPRDRVPEILRALSPLPFPVDLFVLAREELARGVAEGSPLLRVAPAAGIDLLENAGA